MPTTSRGFSPTKPARFTDGWHGLALIVPALGIGTLLIAVTVLVVRAQQTDGLESRLIQLETACRDRHATQRAAHEDTANRLALLERTIFGEVIPKIDRTNGAVRTKGRANAALMLNTR